MRQADLSGMRRRRSQLRELPAGRSGFGDDRESRGAERNLHTVATLHRGSAPHGLLEEHLRSIDADTPLAHHWVAIDARRKQLEPRREHSRSGFRIRPGCGRLGRGAADARKGRPAGVLRDAAIAFANGAKRHSRTAGRQRLESVLKAPAKSTSGSSTAGRSAEFASFSFRVVGHARAHRLLLRWTTGGGAHPRRHRPQHIGAERSYWILSSAGWTRGNWSEARWNGLRAEGPNGHLIFAYGYRRLLGAFLPRPTTTSFARRPVVGGASLGACTPAPVVTWIAACDGRAAARSRCRWWAGRFRSRQHGRRCRRGSVAPT
jgi:hypothetical protein